MKAILTCCCEELSNLSEKIIEDVLEDAVDQIKEHRSKVHPSPNPK